MPPAWHETSRHERVAPVIIVLTSCRYMIAEDDQESYMEGCACSTAFASEASPDTYCGSCCVPGCAAWTICRQRAQRSSRETTTTSWTRSSSRCWPPD